MIGFPKPFHFTLMYHVVVLQPRLCRNIAGLGSFPFARHYLGNHYCFLFLRLLRCFSSPGLPAHLKDVAHPVFNGIGFPIRRSAGQRLLATSPQLIAGCYVLHRFLMSRHPPYTLVEISSHFCFKLSRKVLF